MKTRVLLVLFVLSGMLGSINAQQKFNYLDFKAKKLVVLSDADQLASTYVDGKSGNKTADLVDQLTIIDGDNLTNPKALKTASVSNSVKYWPNSLTVTPDGKYALVSELFGPAPLGESMINDTPVGRKLTIVDVETAKVLSVTDVADGINAIDVHPSGKYVAVSTMEEGKEVIIFPLKNGKLGKAKNIALELAASMLPGSKASHLTFDPTGEFLAISSSFGDETVRFFKFNENDLTLTPYGNAVNPGKLPGIMYWSPNGKYLLVTNIGWGADLPGLYLAPTRGTVAAIRLDRANKGDNGPQNQIVSIEPSRVSPENIAVSPDGKWVVALNFEASLYPVESPNYQPFYSISLFSFNEDTGKITLKDEFFFEGVMPEGVVFDGSSNFLAVAVFDHHDSNQKGGSVDFFRLIDKENPKLIQTKYSIPVMRGSHIIKRID
ncbi:beta-propeller fold lactonase family protein [Psychroserpens damuponensis]|uniref:beta-propeller fold lactonase family protein n=1 Tax=Psychroserpens damuponensis TaxID=943936 RepID=UPI000590876C|nr:beta-propeller fold lactonase family protein [Psychroserpens damuponensis]